MNNYKRFQKQIKVKGNISPSGKEYAMHGGNSTVWKLIFKENDFYSKKEILESLKR